MSAPADSSPSPDSSESPAEPTERAEPTASADRAPERSADDATDESPGDDPRLDPEYVRTLASPDRGDLTLVGVVHDHPASVFRAGAVVRERAPETVALELPPLAVPLYREYARSDRPTPSFGGEMSAAARAARESGADVVGVDAPTRDFLARLARNCWREGASLDTLRRVAGGVASVSRHAAVCRVAAAVADRTGLRVEVDDPVAHDCSRADPPREQARDERRQAERSRSLLRTFDQPEPVALRDETREESMAARLDSLRERGDAVAIVGLDHLDGLATLSKK
ncbi:hypothetical protein [Halorussus marinus]|uniref:hypothetical protein n=1 Tax=Halorussus marinus TaxID=2505976 RepID=UPI001ADC7E9D|nr:hypothetical protein [Halorussus marinus]